MCSSTSNLAVLFKGEHADIEDIYCKELQKIGRSSIVIPVLSFSFKNSEKLLNSLLHPEAHSGIIFTSSRSVEAVDIALKKLPKFKHATILKLWNEKENFSVGEATSRTLELLLDLKAKGEDAGNAQKLSSVIASTFSAECKPFLYPCSSIRKDTLHSVLSAQGIKISEVVSYETLPHPDLQESLEGLERSQGKPEFLVFFSPSGVQFVIPLLKKMNNDLNMFKFLAIGPSTEHALHASGLRPWKVAKKPNPSSLCEALQLP